MTLPRGPGKDRGTNGGRLSLQRGRQDQRGAEPGDVLKHPAQVAVRCPFAPPMGREGGLTDPYPAIPAQGRLKLTHYPPTQLLEWGTNGAYSAARSARPGVVGGDFVAGCSLMRRVLTVVVTVAFLVVLMAGSAFAHPVETPGTTQFVAESGQGHFHGLECAAERSPVVFSFAGTTCAAN